MHKTIDPEVWSARRAFHEITFVFLLGLTLVIVVISALVGWEFPGDHSRPTLRFCLLLICAAVVAGVVARYVFLAAPLTAERPQARTVGDQLFRECFAMTAYALERGRQVPGPVAVVVAHAQTVYRAPADGRAWDDALLSRLTEAHATLSTLLAPALPKALVPLSFQDDPTSKRYSREGLPWLGTVRLVRMMLTLALVLVPSFVVLALLVGSDFRSGTQLVVEGNLVHRLGKGLYLVVTAALGSAFSGLFKARRYVENLSYDDQYESSYWMRFTLGLVAGLLMAVLLSNLVPSQNARTFQLSIPLLALVGGFSSDLVYRLLKRVIDAIGTLVEGSASERVTAAAAASEDRLKRQASLNDARVAESVATAQRGEVESLLGLLGTLPPTPDNQAARAAVSDRLRAVLQLADPADKTDIPVPTG